MSHYHASYVVQESSLEEPVMASSNACTHTVLPKRDVVLCKSSLHQHIELGRGKACSPATVAGDATH